MAAKHPEIIELLNDVLTAELTAINQYFLHAEICGHWGLMALHDEIRSQSIGEMKHAEQLMERILFLGGLPNVQRMGKVNIGENVPEILKSDMALEQEALPRLNEGIALCSAKGDNGTRALLETILQSEEEHIDWIDTQIELVERVGLQNYMAQQMVGTGSGAGA